MGKLKVLFVTLSVMVIAATFYEGISIAAQVTRIHSSRKYVFINGSIADGFVVGANVCFYSSPDSDKPITCGRIEQASESLARVRVNNRIAKQIQYGMEAKLSDEIAGKEEAKTAEPENCADDSECGYSGYCVDGRCQQ
jgi:hypothetical protein